MSIKGSDFIIDFLQKKGCEKFFGVTGGATVHLFDSVEKIQKPKQFILIMNNQHHLQLIHTVDIKIKLELGYSQLVLAQQMH